MRQSVEDEDGDEDLSIYLVEGIPASQMLDIDNIEQAHNDEIDEDFNVLSDNPSTASIAVMKKCVLVQCYDDQNDDYLLSELSPSHIIMYEPNPSFVRRVEIYRTNMAAMEPEDSPKSNINVYFMHYRDSVEEQRYLSSVRREKDAFTKLIREKATMPIQLGHDDDDANGEENSSSLLRTVTSRIAGGQISATAEKPRVIIDAREFRSSLPSLLHAKGFQLIPITLKVGDYILTPDVCVERKSISDLISSLNSGRLMEQCENMVKYYDLPTLLIEFSEAKSFSMEPFSDNAVSQESARMSQENIQQKLTVLFLHFPKLKVIWSPSPHQTAEIIATLKTGRKEPDAVLSKRYGADEDKSNLIGNENDTAISVLRSIPGITFQNYQLIISQVPNIKALCVMSEDEIAEFIGKESARKVVRFLERNLRE
jgi:DNA excision repair protein ERCC-4